MLMSVLETVQFLSVRHPVGIAGDAALQNARLYSEAHLQRCPVCHGNDHRRPCHNVLVLRRT